MKITVVAPQFPFPLDRGDRLTVYNLLKHFSKRHEMSLVCFMEPNQDPSWVNKVQPFCQRIEIVRLRKWRAYANCLLGIPGCTPLQVHYFSDPAMHQAIRRVVRETQPDLLYAHLIRVGKYIEPYRERARVLALQASLTLNYRRLAQFASNWWRKIFYSIEYLKLRHSEAELARKFDKVLLISKHDLNAMAQEAPLDNVFFSPHGVDYSYYSPDVQIQKEPNTLLLTGAMYYAPNIDAALYFYKEILPLVRQQVPDVRWNIIGRDPSSEVLALGEDPYIQVTGGVPDLRPYMNRAQIAIAPMRIAAGLQNKVLEGMAMGLPMVITSAANEGIQAIDGEHVLVADKAQDFANQVVHLLSKSERRIQLGAAAHNFIIQEWSWEKHFRDLEHMFCELVEQFPHNEAHQTISNDSRWSVKPTTITEAVSGEK